MPFTQYIMETSLSRKSNRKKQHSIEICNPLQTRFIAGGVLPHHLDLITGEASPFIKAYIDKGRLSWVPRSIPVFMVLVPDLGLRGAHYYAARRLYRRHEERLRAQRQRLDDLCGVVGCFLAVTAAAVATSLLHKKPR